MRFVENLIVDSNVAYFFIFGIDYFISKVDKNPTKITSFSLKKFFIPKNGLVLKSIDV
jgi:hypothetical protein